MDQLGRPISGNICDNIMNSTVPTIVNIIYAMQRDYLARMHTYYEDITDPIHGILSKLFGWFFFFNIGCFWLALSTRFPERMGQRWRSVPALPASVQRSSSPWLSRPGRGTNPQRGSRLGWNRPPREGSTMNPVQRVQKVQLSLTPPTRV